MHYHVLVKHTWFLLIRHILPVQEHGLLSAWYKHMSLVLATITMP